MTKASKTYILQTLVATVLGLVGAVVGFVIAAPLGAYSDIQIGLVRGYEVTGGIDGSIGAWLGVVLGVWLVAKVMKQSGSLGYSAGLAAIGAVLMSIGVLWLVPVLSTPLMLLVIGASGTLGWHIKLVKR